VSSFLSRYRRTGSIQDAKRSGRKAKLGNDHVKFIDDKMKENDKLKSAELREKMSKECHVEVSATTVRRVKRNVLGW
jgi:transposase